jgi:eukaryotic-like serine/threonine-protein kinase
MLVEDAAALWKFADAEFDEQKCELRVAGEVVELEPRPREILLCLLRHVGETVSKEELLQSVWGHAYLSENALSNTVGKLRKALHDDAQAIIVTTFKVGYRLAVPVVRCAPPAPPQARLGFSPGELVPHRPKWLLERELGVTSGSEVWLAAPAVGETAPRVFKFSPDGQRLPSLKREAVVSRFLQHELGPREELVPVLGENFEQPPFFIESEYGGVSLPEWLEAHGGIGEQTIALRLELLAQVAEAVAMAHSVGVLHTDLKPANIVIQESADGMLRARLIDFGNGVLTHAAGLEAAGFARIGAPNTVQPTSGTLLYLAPELLLGHAPTVRSDLYALGVILYQLVVGDLRRPLAIGWEREIADQLLCRDIADAASGNPEFRLASARDLAERLRNLPLRRIQRRQEESRLAQQQLIATAATKRELKRPRNRMPWLIAACAMFCAGVAAAHCDIRVQSITSDRSFVRAA